MNVYRITIITIALIFFLVTGCSEQKVPEPVVKEAVAEKKTPPEETIKVIPEMDVYPEEVYGDPEIFSEPRLQFVWGAPGEERYTIWTTTLEGDDLRRVVAPELLFKVDGAIIHLPVRSPDNRYLAVAMDTRAVMGSEKVIYDLKEKTYIVAEKGGTVPCFAWTPDSKSLYFYNNSTFLKYDVETKKTEQILPILYSRGLYILDDGRFLTIHRNGYSVHSINQKELYRKSISGGCLSSSTQTISKDGTLLFCEVACNKKPFDLVVNISNPEKVLLKSSDYRITHPVFGPNNKKLYYSRGIVRFLDLETKKTEKVFCMTEGAITRLSIINSQPASEAKLLAKE